MYKVSVQFSKPRKDHFVAKAIRAYQGTPYSHISFSYFSQDFQKDMVIQCTGNGVNEMPFELWIKKHELVEVKEKELSMNRYSEILHIASSLLGSKYDWLTLFLYPVMDYSHIMFGLDDNYSYTCSEFFYEVFRDELGDLGIEPHMVTTKHIYNALFK